MIRSNYRIYGKIVGEKRGGCFAGFYEDNNEPSFGKQKLMYCPIWWDKTIEEMREVCKKIMEEFPNCDAYPVHCGQ